MPLQPGTLSYAPDALSTLRPSLSWSDEGLFETAVEQMNQMLASAQRRIWLSTTCASLQALADLDLPTHFSRVARRSKHTDVRLVVDHALLFKNGQPRLARVIGKLGSSIPVRELERNPAEHARHLLVVDSHAWCFLLHHRAQGMLRLAHEDIAGNKTASEQFYDDWKSSRVAIEFQQWAI